MKSTLIIALAVLKLSVEGIPSAGAETRFAIVKSLRLIFG